MQNVTPAAIAALGLELAPAALFGFASERIARAPPWIGSGASGSNDRDAALPGSTLSHSTMASS